jgi:8-amino-7-oxononanoate synthase
MSLIAGTLSRLRDSAPRPLAAKPFTALSHHRSIKQHEKIGTVLGIENPFFRSAEDPNGGVALIDGKSCLNFAWCDYLSLGQHPELITASKAAIDRYGTCISASRMVAGDTLLHRQLEKELAEFVGVDAALAFVSGHAANVSTIGTLMGKGDLIVHDEFVHNSAVVGMRLSGAEVRCLRHNDLAGLEAILRAERAKHGNTLVVIEGLYSTEGDVPELARIIETKERYVPG